mmetsp:Transcript_32124/g.125332  ORF Transcript_32124/g.125332 Transcript_32124/m.125332 type:complete len:349 (-) Transcript_32124:1618-2664(-)
MGGYGWQKFADYTPWFLWLGTKTRITDEGTLYTWGSGAYGRLGHGDESSLNLPRRNEHLSGRRIVQVALGGFHALALDDQGSVYSWGRSVAAGQDSLDNVYIPSQVRGELENVKVKAVAAGRLHCAAVGEDGSVYTWGNNMEGELGQGDKRNRTVPKRVQGLHDKRAVSVACGRDFTLVLLDDGTLYSFGADDYGQLGLGRGHDQRYVTVPRRVVGGLAEVKEVVAGDYHSCAVTQSGAVFTWGIGREGQLGHGEKSDQAIPKKVDGLDGVEVEQVCCGGGHSGAISSSGELYLWGRGRDGQLGREGELESIAAYRLVPTRVESLRNFSVIQAGLGSDHSAVLAKMKH